MGPPGHPDQLVSAGSITSGWLYYQIPGPSQPQMIFTANIVKPEDTKEALPLASPEDVFHP